MGGSQISEAELLSQAIETAPPSQEFLSKLSTKNYLTAIETQVLNKFDLAFIILHGKWGEDGVIQSLLELASIPYTRLGVMASAIAMDKVMSKKLFMHHGTPTAKWFDYRKDSLPRQRNVKEEISKLGYPNVVKPNDLGSSVAITIVKNESELDPALDEAEKHSDVVFVEEYIPGRRADSKHPR